MSRSTKKKKKKKKKQLKKVCPECEQTHFTFDELHDELYCYNCGLVIQAPPCAELVFPGFKFIKMGKH